jgi:capsular exopolysaccharide synthesis family protein
LQKAFSKEEIYMGLSPQSSPSHISSPLSQERNGLDLMHYLRIVRRRKWAVFGFIFLFLFLGIIAVLKTTPIYSATAKIKADPIQPNANASDQYLMNSMVFLFYETQYEIIQSRKVAKTVVNKLNLVEKYKQEQKKLAEEGDNESWMSSIKASLKASLLKTDSNDSESRVLNDDAISTMLADSIRNQIKVTGGTQSQIINISFESADPQYAADIVNTVADAYVDFGLQTRLDSIEDTSQWLSEQLASLKQRLQDSEERLRQFSASSGMVDTMQQQRISGAQFTSLNTELIRAQTRLSEAEELYNQVKSLNKTDYASIRPVLQSDTVRDLVRIENALKSTVEELSERYGEKHPKMIAARSELSVASDNLFGETNKIIENIGKEYRLAQTQVTNIEGLIKSMKSELQSFQGDSFELTRLEREVENNRLVYESFLGKLMEADVTGSYDGSNISIIDQAVVPSYPIKPRVFLILVAALLAGTFIGLAYIFVRESLADTFVRPDQFEELLNLPSLGLCPFLKKGKKEPEPELKYISDSRSVFSECINTIRTGLLFSNIGLITSSTGGEGKSTLAINLAMAFSQLGKTLLLELDLRKPTIKKKLKLETEVGISDMLTGNTNDTTVLSKVEHAPNLNVLLCGTIPPNPMEIISSEKFINLLESLKQRYEYIVIDSPPTIPVSDSSIIASLADACLVAVKADDTPLKMVSETVKRLSQRGKGVSGAVLTQASPKKMKYYGEHYYQNEVYGES